MCRLADFGAKKTEGLLYRCQHEDSISDKNASLIKDLVTRSLYFYSNHADIERRADDLTFGQVEMALLNGDIIEQYPDTGRGESCLMVGFADDVPIHVVCGWRGEKIVIITAYVPTPPKFVDPWTRGEKMHE